MLVITILRRARAKNVNNSLVVDFFDNLCFKIIDIIIINKQKEHNNKVIKSLDTINQLR